MSLRSWCLTCLQLSQFPHPLGPNSRILKCGSFPEKNPLLAGWNKWQFLFKYSLSGSLGLTSWLTIASIYFLMVHPAWCSLRGDEDRIKKYLKGGLEVTVNRLKNGWAKDVLPVFILGQSDSGGLVKQIWRRGYLSKLQRDNGKIECECWTWVACSASVTVHQAALRLPQGKGIHTDSYSRASVLP